MANSEVYRNRRCRMQRLRDSKILYGWVINYDKKACSIRLAGKNLEFQYDDKFNVDIFGQDTTATFQGTLLSVTDALLHVQIASVIQYRSATENVRVIVTNGVGKMTVGEERMEVEVLDISENGVALSSPEPVPSKSRIRLVMQIAGNSIQVFAEVAYCRKNVPTEGIYRIGAKFTEVDRINRGHILELISNPIYFAA